METFERLSESISRVEDLLPQDNGGGTTLVLLRRFPPRGRGRKRSPRRVEGLDEVNDNGALDGSEITVPDEINCNISL